MKFLVVDDSPMQRSVTKAILREIGINDVTLARDGLEALKLLNDNSYDMVITDWVMPKMDGLNLVEKIRKDNKFSDMPILIVTVKDNKNDVLEAWKAGVDGYIAKPFSPGTLAEKVFELLKAKVINNL